MSNIANELIIEELEKTENQKKVKGLRAVISKLGKKEADNDAGEKRRNKISSLFSKLDFRKKENRQAAVKKLKNSAAAVKEAAPAFISGAGIMAAVKYGAAASVAASSAWALAVPAAIVGAAYIAKDYVAKVNEDRKQNFADKYDIDVANLKVGLKDWFHTDYFKKDIAADYLTNDWKRAGLKFLFGAASFSLGGLVGTNIAENFIDNNSITTTSSSLANEKGIATLTILGENGEDIEIPEYVMNGFDDSDVDVQNESSDTTILREEIDTKPIDESEVETKNNVEIDNDDAIINDNSGALSDASEYFSSISIEQALDNPKLGEAIRLFEEIKENGYAWDKEKLGLMFLYGDGVEANKELAYKLIEEAAGSGYEAAKTNQAYMLYNGIGTERNIDAAIAIVQETGKAWYGAGCDIINSCATEIIASSNEIIAEQEANVKDNMNFNPSNINTYESGIEYDLSSEFEGKSSMEAIPFNEVATNINNQETINPYNSNFIGFGIRYNF